MLSLHKSFAQAKAQQQLNTILVCHSVFQSVLHLIVFKSYKCRMVGRPWGQFQGCSMVLSLVTIPVIWLVESAVPIITADRQAREANIDTNLGSRIILVLLLLLLLLLLFAEVVVVAAAVVVVVVSIATSELVRVKVMAALRSFFSTNLELL